MVALECDATSHFAWRALGVLQSLAMAEVVAVAPASDRQGGDTKHKRE
jgi:hypothetical protein